MKRILLLCGLAACAHNPAMYVAASETRPSVKVDVEERNVVETDHVGTATQTDKNGVVVGYTDLTQDRVVGRERYVAGFDLVRGEELLDERDYYHLAGDDAAAKEIDDYRARGMTYNHVGLALLAVGAVGVGMMVSGNDGLAKVGTPMFAIGMPVGGILAIMGRHRMEGHHMPLERALEAVGQPAPTLGPVGALP
jgi:hypothetical protein